MIARAARRRNTLPICKVRAWACGGKKLLLSFSASFFTMVGWGAWAAKKVRGFVVAMMEAHTLFFIVIYLTVYVSFIYLVAVDVWEGGTNRAKGSRMPKRMRGQRGRQDRAISRRVEDLSWAGYHWYTCNFHFMISRRCRWQPEPAWHILIPEID